MLLVSLLSKHDWALLPKSFENQVTLSETMSQIINQSLSFWDIENHLVNAKAKAENCPLSYHYYYHETSYFIECICERIEGKPKTLGTAFGIFPYSNLEVQHIFCTSLPSPFLYSSTKDKSLKKDLNKLESFYAFLNPSSNFKTL